MRFLKEIRVPSHAEQLENEGKPFVAVWYGDGGEHSHNVEERISREEAVRLEQLAREGKI